MGFLSRFRGGDDEPEDQTCPEVPDARAGGRRDLPRVRLGHARGLPPGAGSAPHLLSRLHDQPQLVGLLLARERVALDRGGEAALR